MSARDVICQPPRTGGPHVDRPTARSGWRGDRCGATPGSGSTASSPTLGITPEIDAAGNSWATLEGESDRTVIIGSHLDSVPNGGWLDGALGVMAGFEALRMFKDQRAAGHHQGRGLGGRGRRAVRAQPARFIGRRRRAGGRARSRTWSTRPARGWSTRSRRTASSSRACTRRRRF